MENKPNHESYLELAANIVCAYVSNPQHTVNVADIPAMIQKVYEGILAVNQAKPKTQQDDCLVLKPAVNVEESVMPDYIICLEDGRKLKMLKRHLKTAYNMTPEEYRVRWGLSADYPMVAPRYAERRSSLAKHIGLGNRKGGRTTLKAS
jgi:predicted transcriptional regulator